MISYEILKSIDLVSSKQTNFYLFTRTVNQYTQSDGYVNIYHLGCGIITKFLSASQTGNDMQTKINGSTGQ